MPQLGCVAGALGIHRIVTGRDTRAGMRFLALAHRLRARQDLPSLRLAGYDEAARAILGDDVVTRELERAKSISRAVAAREVLDTL